MRGGRLDQDMLDDLETPQYLKELPRDEPDEGVSQLLDHVWVSKPNEVGSALEELEEEDRQHRAKLSQSTQETTSQAEQLHLQRQVYASLVDFVMRLHSSEVLTPEQMQDLIIKLEQLEQYFGNTTGDVWQELCELTRVWSRRADLKIGVDIPTQAEKEAERRSVEDWSLFAFLAKELKTEQTTIIRVTKKKAKHKASKHRRLKFDVHEKLLNFMTPAEGRTERRHELLIQGFLGRKREVVESKVPLDVPLI
mmetsp:Transcript_17168/g.30866  ORF Transcript_17168/g.30866 Transcript_17168/m.30866 type:complete len:252 (-) Transcript_17168:29-784(-)